MNWTVAVPALGLAVGPLFWSSLSNIIGRRIIFIIGTITSLVSTCGAAATNNYNGYMAARFFQGFGVSPASSVGMAVINDLFFDYERGQKLGMWTLAIDSGLLLGPTFGGFLNVVSAAWINWFNAILFALLLVLELVLMPETLYPRNLMLGYFPMINGKGEKTAVADQQNQQPETDTNQVLELNEKGQPAQEQLQQLGGSLPQRTKTLSFINLKPVPAISHAKPYDALVRFFLTFPFMVVSIGVIGYCFLWYWWILSIVTMVPSAYANYSPLIQGLLFLGLFIGTLFAEIFFSGKLSDYIGARLAKRNSGERTPEMRLFLAYPAIVLSGGKTVFFFFFFFLEPFFPWKFRFLC